MSLFSDIGNFVSSAVSTAASVVSTAASAMFPEVAIAASLGNMVTQGLGQGLSGLLGQLTQGGMPGFIGKEIGNLIHSVIGQLTQPSDPGCNQHCHESFGQEVGDFVKQLLDGVAQDTCNQAKGKSGGSWFEALAKALGKALDAQAADVKAKSDAVQGQNASDNPSGFTDLQSASQRMSFMMSAADQVIKTIGEGLGSLARKQ